jgi:SAM-dependent methyltransferase
VTFVDELRVQERAWDERPLLRALYREWFELIAQRLAPGGPTVELGAGIAKFREVVPDAEATDIEPTPWTDVAVDAERLPYADASVANLVLIDVFHHLPSPKRFVAEAVRVLRPGGRVLILDPYCSPVSTIAYKAFHHERTDLGADAYADDESLRADPLASNQARATLVFFRRPDGLPEELRIVERLRLSFVEYPLSGGFTKRPLLRVRLRALERMLQPLAPLLAFRCLIVLERR